MRRTHASLSRQAGIDPELAVVDRSPSNHFDSKRLQTNHISRFRSNSVGFKLAVVIGKTETTSNWTPLAVVEARGVYWQDDWRLALECLRTRGGLWKHLVTRRDFGKAFGSLQAGSGWLQNSDYCHHARALCYMGPIKNGDFGAKRQTLTRTNRDRFRRNRRHRQSQSSRP